MLLHFNDRFSSTLELPKEQPSLKGIFCFVSAEKSIQISKYCFLIGRHSNLD